ncbi:ribosomal-protein-alanine N-acetyltransferase [Haloechinothrix alba]|uniref:Ribosomal-protein-alanine N-acetyltransferase n=1 Tax=Haloechinothrix alba TaxID=664784 RepID=A0A238VGZ6_9PSEU|nr:GNAT family protein [Haloechinothrix alba]SNR33347.1 ribosomal-protein-alanine N-acetyltransferase [Haloechinothrix alba]
MYPDARGGSVIGSAESGHPGWPARLGPVRARAGVVALRPLWLRDGAAWRRIRLDDRDHLEQWEPSTPGSWKQRHTLTSWWTQWWSLRSLARRGQCLPFAITVDGAFGGQLTIGNVVRSALCSGWVGYWVASGYASGGVATAALGLAADHAFTAAGLHRLEATVRPENAASLRVLTKAGFRQEGLFLRYLHVAGAWRDHYCYATTTEDSGTGVVAGMVAAGLIDRE